MIPYFIQEANSSQDVRDNNIYITYNSSERCNMNERIICYIINVMYEFCSKEYGHDIKITSYDDFCDKYWEMKEIRIREWYNIFRVYYFETKWIEWNIEDYKDDIYVSYVDKFGI